MVGLKSGTVKNKPVQTKSTDRRGGVVIGAVVAKVRRPGDDVILHRVGIRANVECKVEVGGRETDLYNMIRLVILNISFYYFLTVQYRKFHIFLNFLSSFYIFIIKSFLKSIHILVTTIVIMLVNHIIGFVTHIR